MNFLRATAIGLVVLSAAVGHGQGSDASFDKKIESAANLFKAGKLDESIKAFEVLHTASSRSYETLSWLGFLYLRANQPGKAVPVLEQAVGQRSDDIEVLNNLGNAYMATNQYDRALERYAAVIKLNTKMFEPHYNAGTIYLQRKLYLKAIPEFMVAATLKPEDPFVKNNLGVAYEAVKDEGKAIAAYVKASDMRPENRTFARNAGLLLSKRRSPDAIKYLERALGDGTDSAVSMTLGEEYVRADRIKDALTYYESLRTIEASNATFWFNLAVIRGKTGDQAGSEQAYRRVLELSPNDLDSLNNLGLLLYRQGKYPDATTLFDKLAGLAPGMLSAKLNLAASAARSGQMDKAIEAWKEILRSDPNRPQVRLDLANALWDSGDTDGAKFHYNQVLVADKNNADALNGLGLCHLKAGKFPQAEAAFRTAIDAKPTLGAAYCNLAITLERMGNKVDAVKILEKGAKAAPDDDSIKKNLDRLRSG